MNKELDNIINKILKDEKIDMIDYFESCLEYAYEYFKDKLSKENIDVVFDENNKSATWVFGELNYVKREKRNEII